MPRQKKKKPRRQWSHREAPTPFETSLEEDLAKQRRRQQQRQLEAEKRKKLEPPQEQQQQQQQQLHEGLEIEFSQIHKRPVRPEDIIFKGLQTSTLDDLTGLSSLSLAYAQTQCSILSPYHRHRVRQVWQTKYLLELLHINPRASALYSHKFKWLDYSLPDGMHCSWDLTCKHFLHPSARTFDVALFSEGSPQQLPTIATAVQGGWGLFQPPRGRDHRVHTLRGYVSTSCQISL